MSFKNYLKGLGICITTVLLINGYWTAEYPYSQIGLLGYILLGYITFKAYRY